MTDDIKVPAPVEALIRAVTGAKGDGDDDERAMTFARGLALGALVGAAIAGSSLWQRRQARAAALARLPSPSPGATAQPVDPPAVDD